MTGDNTLIHSHGINRRDFMKLCAALAATVGLAVKPLQRFESVTYPQRPASYLDWRAGVHLLWPNLCFVQRIQQ
ncbi:twin-arginine translocation signal domain-containing protein [Shigella sonnei]|uniref:twin-arginine translocation signal domain-containing protein n=1 Tax=Shigella sonnei TaxID=624 RepID=UPI00311DC3E4